jgi:hypothetical protein
MNDQLMGMSSAFGGITIWEVLKWFYVLAFGLYVLFAIVVIAQIRQMVRVLHWQSDQRLVKMGLIHLGVAVAALLAAIVIL